jgi:hypothetical protein
MSRAGHARAIDGRPPADTECHLGATSLQQGEVRMKIDDRDVHHRKWRCSPRR